MAKTTQIMLTTCATSKNNQGKAMGLANASGGGNDESDKAKGRRGDSGGEGSTRDSQEFLKNRSFFFQKFAGSRYYRKKICIKQNLE